MDMFTCNICYLIAHYTVKISDDDLELPSDTMLYYTEHSFVYVMKELKTTYTIDIFQM